MYPINVQQMFEPKDGTRSKINGTRSKMCKTPFTGALSPVNGGFAAVKVSRVGVRVSFGTRTFLKIVHVHFFGWYTYKLAL